MPGAAGVWFRFVASGGEVTALTSWAAAAQLEPVRLRLCEPRGERERGEQERGEQERAGQPLSTLGNGVMGRLAAADSATAKER
jgi:hypothetical protein